jgi:hypothetical protein
LSSRPAWAIYWRLYLKAKKPRNKNLRIFFSFKNNKRGTRALVAHAYNPSYSKGRDQEDRCLKPAQGNSLGDPHLKKALHKKRLVSGSRCGP